MFVEGSLTETLPRPLGFVLSGGGSLGAIQAGMLQALAEAKITPDMVTGTSVGSLNGAVLALRNGSALKTMERLRQIWTHLTKHEVFPGRLFSQMRTLRRSKTNLFSNSGLTTIIIEHLGSETRFEDLAIPLGIVTTDIETRQPLLIRSGTLLTPLLASCAIPGIFPPIRYQGKLLYDGGLVANVPMRQALSMGAKSLVVLDCTLPGQNLTTPHTFAEVMMFTIMTGMRNQAVLETPLVAAEVPVVYLPGLVPAKVSPLDFSRTAELFDQAYDRTQRYLEK